MNVKLYRNTGRASLFSVFMLCLLLIIPVDQTLAVGPVTIKWIRICGYPTNYEHNRYVMGLSDGNKLWGYYNPNQGRAATFSILLSAYMAGKNIYYENATAQVTTMCGVTTTHQFHPVYTYDDILMIGDP